VLEAALPAVGLQAYGGGVDSSDGAPVFTWQWSIISTNYTGAPALTTPTAQNTLVDVDEWVNIRLFLIATNTNNAAVSESNPALAPDSAFVVVQVYATASTLTKLADGERNFIDPLNLWPKRINDLATTVPAHLIVDHDTTATGAQLTTLTDGSSATTLHTHLGLDVDIATTANLGVVKLEDAPATAIPKMITKERIVWTGSTFQSITSGGIVNDISAFGLADIRDGIFYFYAMEEVTLVQVALAMNDGGLAAPSTDYVFSIEHGTMAQFIASTYAVITTLTGTPAVSLNPFEIISAPLGAKVLAGTWVRVRCSVEASTPGLGLHATLTALRHV
tara:strand:+ start:70 stop:1071 length:1002 start_codon:yes stop_codon:yes gene_type:complete